ncbi:BrnT family toxin [Devosia sp.]|uniref:BrnT family toxin n=1 Tax=Devosia sp. TaxID=1871048 RepID=UPI001B236137|nr:BrnT family toxin [Devosia sp.]MBO9588737.1 BrnT family toxin [Devosia sp.]
MIDWTVITGFEWDDGNTRKSADKHSVSQAEAEQMFFNQPLLTLIDHLHSVDEIRIHALGHTDDGRSLHVTFTLRQDETKIRVISARDMSRKERAYYEQNT